MADPIADNIVIIIAVLVIGLAVLTFIELKYLRKTSKGRRIKAAQAGDLPDRAHNAILTTKAISRTLAAAGVVTRDADDLVREAEMARRNRDYRVVIELTDRAKSMLKAEKARHDAMGDLSRLRKASDTEEAEPTAKELLQKDLPPNYIQAKFTISLADERIQVAAAAGRGTAQAEEFLRTARATFETKDYDGALRLAVKSRRIADGEEATGPPAVAAASAPHAAAPSGPPAPPVAPARPARACASCGAALKEDDTFCRKCGVKVERPTTCGKCGASLVADDGFCRKCGTPVT
ncbi:MAG: hypothetical protein A3K65_09390 [Euryarchaeota archaeon RBG_16_68_12]|nr:MAG: hypothetical protein A3K65_09390 [Euryarchaeota archaeon RBG_16_68_12]